MDKQVVKMDGQQVFTADWVFQQMQAQNSRIDRAKAIATFSAVVAAISIALNLVLLLR